MNTKTQCLFVVMLIGLLIGYQGSGSTTWAKLRIGTGADIQADGKTVREIEAAFIRAEAAINEGDVDSLMELYSQDYHYGKLNKHDMKAIWEGFFRKYHYSGPQNSDHRFSKMRPWFERGTRWGKYGSGIVQNLRPRWLLKR